MQRGDDPQKGRWAVPGGSVEPGESLAQAAQREALEETGLRVQVEEELVVAEIPAGAGRLYEVHSFRAVVLGGELVAGDDASDARWVPLDELDSYPLTSNLKESLREAGVI